MCHLDLAMNDQDQQIPEDSAQESEGNDHDMPVDGDLTSEGELSVESRLAEAEQMAGDFRDQMLRAHAELENTRKRADKEIERIRKYALESFAIEMLDIKDNLERGLSDNVNIATIEDMQKGVRLTLKSLERVFDRFGIKEVDTTSQVFDPEFHQAMSTIKTDEHAPNTVLEVAQKGYTLSDRLLRPAMVVVAVANDTGKNEDKQDCSGGKEVAE